VVGTVSSTLTSSANASGDAWPLATLTLLGAGLIVVHVVLLIRTARAEGLSWPLRLLAWLPPATPVIGWLGGARVLSALWVVQLLAYAILRATSG
jgi:hypothetical protein